MLPFEDAILALFKQSNISFVFDEKAHFLSSDSFKISFVPNISNKESHYEIDNDASNTIVLNEDFYLSNPGLVISRINSLLGQNERIHGRETKVSVIEEKEFEKFLIDNHLNGPTKSKFRYGLFYKNQLVAAAGFGRSCPIDHEGNTYRSHELIRFCNKRDVTVVGGLSKLLTIFIKEKKPEHIMTYIDKEWSDGNSFVKLGFTLLDSTKPETFLISPEFKRYRVHEAEKMAIDSLKWKRITNLGNHKFIKILV